MADQALIDALRKDDDDGDEYTKEMKDINKGRGKFFGTNPKANDPKLTPPVDPAAKKVDPYGKTLRGQLSKAFDKFMGPKGLDDDITSP
jgi:hypothetical protein